MLAVPSRVTVVPICTFWFSPALATGAELVTLATMVTLEAALLTLVSLTIKVMV